MPDRQSRRADVHETLDARNRQIAAVHVISRLLSSSIDLEDRLRDILTVSLQAVGAVAGTIFLYRVRDDTLVFRYVVGEKAAELTGQAMRAASGLAGAVFRLGRSQITNHPHDAIEHDIEVETKTGFRTTNMVTIPLRYQAGRPVGVMQILNMQMGGFDDDDLEVLEIVASVAAAAIETAQLAREAQTAAIARAVGNLSHDLKNKVAPIAMATATLRPDMDAMFEELDRIAASASADVSARLRQGTAAVRQAYGETFDIVTEQVHAVQEYTKLIADALQGTVTRPQLEPNDLAAVIEAQLSELEPVARNQAVTLVRRFASRPVCRFDRFQVERAVYNLVNNAIPETLAGGTVTVAVDAKLDGRFPDGGFVEIVVADTGRGMPADVLERILRGDPKSTKPGGTGLGTRIVHNAVAAHRGVFAGESAEGTGTTFRLKLPLLAE
jgi:signal transduction histidine kinase